MAFSSAQEQYIDSIISAIMTNYPSGYYVVFNEFDSSTPYDLIIYASNERIYYTEQSYSEISHSYRFNCDDDYVYCFRVISSNPGYNDSSLDRVVFTNEYVKDSFLVPRTSTISTNAESFAGDPLFPDIALSRSWYYDIKNQGFSIGLGVLVLLLVLLNFVRWVFGKHRGS